MKQSYLIVHLVRISLILTNVHRIIFTRIVFAQKNTSENLDWNSSNILAL